MKTEKKSKNTTTEKTSTPIPVWNNYNLYHDYLTTILSFGRKNNASKFDVWNFEYV